MTTATMTPLGSRTPVVLSWLLFFLSLAGVVVSAISLVNHYRIDPTEYCDFNQYFNCDIVNRSIYSRFPANSAHALPVAVIGLAGYIAIAVLALIRSRKAGTLLVLASVIGLGFSVYLTYIEARVLHVWCILCLGSLALIVLITALSAAGLRATKETP